MNARRKSHQIWVSRALESPFPFRIRSPFLASIVKFGVPLDLGFTYLLLRRHGDMSLEFILAAVSALAWLNLGPYLIWCYDERLLPRFFERVRDLMEEPRRADALEERYDRLFARKWWTLTIPLAIIVAGVLAVTPAGLPGSAIQDRSDPAYWVVAAAALWTAVLGSIGFFGVLVTLLVVRRIAREPIAIDPIHPDRLGGIGCVGTYAIGTTVLFSTGSLFLPAGFLLAGTNPASRSLVYAAVFAFSGFVLLSFLYPTLAIHQQAKVARDRVLYRLWREQRALRGAATDAESAKQLEHLQNEYAEYQGVHLYPFQTRILVELTSSVLLPLGFLLLQIYLSDGW